MVIKGKLNNKIIIIKFAIKTELMFSKKVFQGDWTMGYLSITR